VFGMDVLTYPQIDAVVLDFPIFPAVGNGEAQSVDFGLEGRQKLGVFAPQILGGTYEHPPRRVAKFRENRPRDVEKSGGKKIK